MQIATERETSLELANLLLGKQTLYQLSYSRVVGQILFVLSQPAFVAEVSSGLSTVIVRASDLALCNLRC